MRIAVCLPLCIAAACAPTDEPAARPLDRPIVEAQLDSLMRAYANAFEALDGDRVMAFYAPAGDMLGRNDGQPLSYDDTASQLKGFLQAARSISIQYEEVKPHAVTSDVGVIWTTLRESWVDTTGARSAIRVLVSWVAHRTEGGWRLVYFDGRHTPIAADSAATR